MFHKVISTAAEGAAHIEQAIARLDLPGGFSFEANTKNRLVVLAVSKTDPLTKLDLRLHFDPDFPSDLIVSYFTLGGKFRKRGLSPFCVRGMLGAVSELNQAALYIHGVEWDGHSFWTSLGAKPLYEITSSVGPDIRTQLRNTGDRLTAGQRAEFESIAAIADRDPPKGFDFLSQNEIRETGGEHYWKHYPLSVYLASQDLVIVPPDPVTNKILAAKAGPLPDFAPVPENDYLLTKILQKPANVPVLR